MDTSISVEKYDNLVSSKQFKSINAGFDAKECDLNTNMKPFQNAITRWALRRGRAAVFEDTGLGKTIQFLSWCDAICRYTSGKALIVSPLCVSAQTVEEAVKFGIEGVSYARYQDDATSRITVTNYEMLDHFDASKFEAVALEEGSILKNQTGKMRQKIIDTFQHTPYRLTCSATPAPNDHMELGSQAEFLGIMTATEMLSMFFIHDGGDTSKWRLKGHGKKKFWEWMATWAVVIQKPSDIGFDDSGYDLPALNIIEHVVKSDTMPDDGNLFAMPAKSLQDTRREQRESIQTRVDKAANIVNDSDEPWIVWCHLNDESDELNKRIEKAVDVKGAHTVDQKESRIMAFTNGDAPVIVTKPSIAGFGMNWQHCRNQVFVGSSYSWESRYQAIRRSWRFGQKNEVNIHLIQTENEGHIKATLERKERQSNEMTMGMISVMSDIMKTEINGATREHSPLKTRHESGDEWKMYLGDCVKTMSELESDSVDYSIFSPPFASLYTYSNSQYDMGNTCTRTEFYKQFEFCISQLYRVLSPGRLLSFHCMNLPLMKQSDGVIGMVDFRGELIRMFSSAGFIFHSEVTIWKDPVTEMQRTKAIGLLHKQIKKDSSMSRNGMPDYLVTMRKPGENKEKITHTPEDFPVCLWQRYASPVWMDINMSDTLNRNGARDSDDEKHICPLQLGVIRRALKLWTNPGDTVLTPFAGIGSEVFVAIQSGRKGIGIELKESYFNMAIKNCESAARQTTMFSNEI